MADTNLNFEEIEQEQQLKNQRQQQYTDAVNRQVKNTTGVYKEYDQKRYNSKAELKQLIAAWREQLKDDKEVLKDKQLAKLLDEVEAYADMDVTATHVASMTNVEDIRRDYSSLSKGNKEESQKVSAIFAAANKYMSNLEKSEDIKKSAEEEALLARRQIMAANIQMYFGDQLNGYLEPVPKGALHIKVKDSKIELMAANKETRKKDSKSSFRDRPLFPHDPSPSDISQGQIGDCYMVAALANIARNDPDKIKEAIRDNGDGTVTVRLFHRVAPQNQPEKDRKDHDIMEPYYVTVDKTVPDNTAAENCLWAAMIEKAVVASGRNVDREYNQMFAKSVPANIDELYEKYKKMPEHLRPSKMECPWLFDDNNNLVKWTPAYKHIEGGHTDLFTETFLGEGYDATRTQISNVRAVVGQEIAYEYVMTLLEERFDSAYTKKARQVLDKQEDVTKRLENSFRLYYAAKTMEIGRYYTPTLTADGKITGFSIDLDTKYHYFAQQLGYSISNKIYESNKR